MDEEIDAINSFKLKPETITSLYGPTIVYPNNMFHGQTY